jgi:hypothetical protein
MLIGSSTNTSFTYSSLQAHSITGQVSLTGSPEVVSEAATAMQNARRTNIAGKLNSLEHTATTNPRPMFLKGVLQKMADVKVRDIDIAQVELDRSSVALDATQLSASTEAGLTYEQLHLDSNNMSLAFHGRFRSKAGDELGFDLQLSSSKVSAAYAALSQQISTSGETPSPEQVDVEA